MSVLEIPAEKYHADEIADRPTLSASIAKLLLTASPAHAKAAHPKLNPNLVRQDEQRFDVGTASHALLLEGISAVAVIPYENWRTKPAQEAKEEARANGLIPLLATQWDEVQAMCAATRAQLDAYELTPPLFTDGQPEKTLVWEDDHGVVCRARLDWLRHDHGAIDDFKSTSRTANPEQWCRSTLYSINADIQAAFYLRGCEKALGVRPEFRFVVQETFSPYALSVVSLGPDVLALADKKVGYAIDLWARCLRADSWPAYPARVATAELPAWEESRWLEREMREVMA